MRPLFPFYGSKWRDAKRYPPPRDGLVVEPFAGSAGYSLWHEPSRVGQSVDELDLCQEARWLIGFWLNRGSAQPKKTKTAYSARTERSQLVWSERARERIAVDVEGVRDWQVVEGSYDQAPMDAGSTYFVDPPYVDKGRYYRVNHVDHSVLGLWCLRLPGRAIVCEQEGATWLPFEPLASIKSSRGRSSEVVLTAEGPNPFLTP